MFFFCFSDAEAAALAEGFLQPSRPMHLLLPRQHLKVTQRENSGPKNDIEYLMFRQSMGILSRFLFRYS